MATRSQQVKRRSSLADAVRETATAFPDVISASLGPTRQCRGERKVKVPKRWPIVFPTTLVFSVFDGDNGNRDVLVRTTKPGAISRLIGKQLLQQGIHVC